MPPGPDPDVTAREILLFMVQSTDPGLTAQEIAEEFDKTRQWGGQRLRKLDDRGLVNSKNPGGNARFYWVSDEGKDHLQKTG